MSRIYFKNDSLEINPLNRGQNKKIFLSDYEKSILIFIDEWFSAKKKWSLNTSGSTGNPKSITMSRTLMEYSARQTNQVLKLQPNDTALLTINANFIGGRMMIVRSLLNEMNLIVNEPSTSPMPSSVSQTIDFAAFVPLQIYAYLKNPASERFLRSIKKIIIGGAPLNQAAINSIQQYSNTFYQTYGMTETYSHVALKTLNGPKKNHFFKGVGDVLFTVDNEKRLIINGTITNQIPLLTNDIVELKDEKTFLWKGRYDHVINSGGIKILPEQLEIKISNSCKEILEGKNYFISSKEDLNLGKKVVLYVEGLLDTQELIHSLRKSLSKYEIPKEVISLPVFEYTTSGKINRNATLKNEEL